MSYVVSVYSGGGYCKTDSCGFVSGYNDGGYCKTDHWMTEALKKRGKKEREEKETESVFTFKMEFSHAKKMSHTKW